MSGYSVSISADGSRVAIASQHNDEKGKDAGLARVYEWNTAIANDWTKIGSDIYGAGVGDRFPNALQLNGDGSRMITSAAGNDAHGDKSGHVRVYEWETDDWKLLGSEIHGNSDNTALGLSGSISADGSRIAVGGRAVPALNDPDDCTGFIRMYEWNTDGKVWTQLGTRDITGDNPTDYFGPGIWMSADGTTVAAGAYERVGTEKATKNGYVRVYTYPSV